MKLLFVRHGETAKNAKGSMHKTGDSELLNSTGRIQVQKVSKALEAEGVTVVYSSPEYRAKESAEILGKMLHVKVVTLGELAERNWGKWEQRTWPKIKADLTKMSLEERYNFAPPNGESWKQMEQRLKQALQTIQANNGTPVIVTHMGALRGLMPILLEEKLEVGIRYEFENASISTFEYDRKHYKTVKLNSTSHLK